MTVQSFVRTRSPVEVLDSWANRDQPSVQPDLASASILRAVTSHAGRAPGDIAIISGEHSVRYGELECDSNRIARYLRGLGATTGALVAICLPRSPGLVSAALGIMKTGAGYVPFDPMHPAARIVALLEEAAPVAVVTNDSLASLLNGNWKVLALDRDAESISKHSAEPLDLTLRSEGVAYVIYTSGSTGQAKGVRVPHRALWNLIEWHQQAFSVTSSDRATLLASPAFDASVWETWPYLAAGSSIHVIPDSIRNDPHALQSWLIAEKITIAFAPTALAEQLIAFRWPPETNLRSLLTGADTLHKFPPADLPFTLVNNYGPTECAVVTTSGVAPPGVSRTDLPTIGRPISNVQVHILDKGGTELPWGTTGEICVSGAGVALGYLNAPELTAAKFIPNPFDSEQDSRLYRTGDLGRYLPDGQIAFVGRIDDQIKIRGYRVEPNEVAAVLSRHPAVRECVVVARENDAGDKALIAYVACDSDPHLQADGLRRFLCPQLPEYMIPSQFVRVSALPLNASGKVDRPSLPAPAVSNTLEGDMTARALTRFEERLSQIVIELLGVMNIGVSENFFLLGGHSLFATQLIARIRQAFDVDLSLRTIFNSPTIAELAAEVEQLLCVRLEMMSDTEAEQALKTFCDPAQ